MSCTRRKVKCSKTVPCTNCIRRYLVDTIPDPTQVVSPPKIRSELTSDCASVFDCRGEQNTCGTPEADHVATSTSTTPIDAASAVSTASASLGSRRARAQRQHEEISNLRRRVAELEAERQRDNNDGDMASRSSSPVEPPTTSNLPSMAGTDIDVANESENGTPSHDTVVEDAASILEFLAWGRRKDPEYRTIAVASPEAVVKLPQMDVSDIRDAHMPAEFLSSDSGAAGFDDLSQLSVLQLLLPNKRRTWDLVVWHEQNLLWYHCSYYAPSLRRQLESFYDNYDGSVEHPEVNLQWVAFLFAVLTGSMTCLPKRTAERLGFAETEQETLSKRWFQAVIVCLNKADYAANHCILSVQAIATLTVSAHLLGFSNLQSIHLAAAVRIAQSLGLHRLTAEVPGSEIEKESGRRVWAQLCSQDWFNIPFSETYLINPLYSRSDLPMNCHDDDVSPLPDSIPTVTSYNRFLHSIASIMPRLQDGLMACNTLFTKYEKVIKWDKELRSLATTHRPVWLSNMVIVEPAWPEFITWARQSLAISSSHKIIMIHRSFLSESFTNPAFAFTRRTCLAASKTIIKEYKEVIDQEACPVLWIHQAFSVAASIILILDIFHRDHTEPEALEHLKLAEDTVVILEKCNNSMIARRGVRLLSALLKERASSSHTDGSSNINDNNKSMNTRKRRWHDGDLEKAPSRSGARALKRPRTLNIPAFVTSFCADPENAMRLPPTGQRPQTTGASHCQQPYVPPSRDSPFEAAQVGFDGTSFENLLYLANQEFYSF